MTVLVLLIIYAGVLYFLINRLKQIRKYPKKFDAVPGYEEYRKSIWYWPTYREHGKGTPPDDCAIPATLLATVLMVVWYWVTHYLYLVLLIRGKGGENLFISNAFHGISLLYIVVFSFFWGAYLTMYSKRPAAICFNLHTIYRRETRSTALEKMTKAAILLTFSMFFIRALMMYNYGYVDSGKIVYSPVLSLEEQIFDLGEIDSFDMVRNESGNKIEHCDIYNEQGQKFDLAAKYDFLDSASVGFLDYAVEHLPEEQGAELREYLLEIDPEWFG